MFKYLSQASAFGAGSDLWVFPDLEYSKWLRVADWYLAFQIARLSKKGSPTFHQDLSYIITECELSFKETGANAQSPLLIASTKYLPNRWTSMVPYQNSLKEWMSQVLLIANNLATCSLRIFLPLGCGKDQLIELATDKIDTTIVMDTN
jgi:hypothetical protein